MKKYLLYIIFILPLLFLGCDTPTPTQLVADEEVFDIEILGKDVNDEFYSNGYDSSGVIEDRTNFASIISVSGIKLTQNNVTVNISSAQTIIFDKTKPFRSPNNILLGYKTIVPGIIKFDNVQARLANYRVRYREAGNLIDSVLGKKYELFHIHGVLGDLFTYPYNSSINFSYNPFFSGQISNFDIITPKEIIGSVQIITTKQSNNYRAELKWNGEMSGKFSIVIGGIRNSNQQNFPFYRIRTMDDGSFILPSALLQNIPRDRFNKITISFVRKFDKLTRVQDTDLYVSSQSIHTIIIDIP